MTAMPNVSPGDRVAIVADGETLHRVVTAVHADGSFDVADPDAPALSPLVESLFRGEYSGPSVTEAPEHRAARLRTDEEQAALKPYATGGAVESGVTGDESPPWLTTCAYDNGGFLPPGLEWWRNDTGQPIPLDGTEPFPPGLTRVSDGEVTR